MTQHPLPSRRIRGINEGGSDGWEMFYRAKEMIAQGIPVLELTIGEHDIKTDPAILDAMHAAARGGHTGYASIPGIADLRAAVARRTERMTGVPTRAENVIVTPGAQAALFAAHQFVGDPGDRALFVDPYYATYPGTIRAAGLVPVAVEARAEDGFEPREEALDAVAAGARSLLVNSPNNPTGVLYGERTLAGIARVAERHDLWVISDEVYDSQVWEGRHLSPRAVPGLAERCLVVGSMSKSHAMTGSRLGWVVAPESAIALLWDLSTVTNYGIPGFIQDAGVFALALGDEFEARIAEPFRRRREITQRLLSRQQVVGLAPQRGAMYAMLDLRATGLSGIAFAERLLEEEQVAVMPGESFGRAAAGHVRVAMTVADDLYEEALGRILRLADRLAAEARRARAS
ncbi:pyridoxal phosphate-dependent aminotransferase [Rubellimicrobium sp. CFH 75288]|uniref:pyridoxal phosphate-dependent aminotransferase n=1 Tax=Rubellimicrobium sp. CFH 75288 TaxID=2697034 RepID=UPI001412E39A|nr:aminotransferase class I/II-fold pyridoxal phosphate-dependent enzyme [Rubellimicrobium sp. CFH 75288]NAZ35222.1 aminotransferase class I/II-fold pyridoxal phosphate-dependent enzyme [Rubellimicrobium sp. CFH 75288]